MQQKGQLSVETQHILPLIQSSLYTDTDVFLRELVSNASDACNKMEYTTETPFCKININPGAQVLDILDNGIGMSLSECDAYLNNIAVSSNISHTGSIGKFGLGFYSAFMVANKIEVYSTGAIDSCKWTGFPDGTYELIKIPDYEKLFSHRGTLVRLYLKPDFLYLLDESHIKKLIEKWCLFIQIQIYVNDYKCTHLQPIWHKSDISDTEALLLANRLYPSTQTISYIQLSVDTPSIKGILYICPINIENPHTEGISLYCNNVFITKETEGILPKWLNILYGIIEIPSDILQVSRSGIQLNTDVKKIQKVILEKLILKIGELSSSPDYRTTWNILAPIIKVGCLSDAYFALKISSNIGLTDTNNNFYLLNDLKKSTIAHKNISNLLCWLYTTDKQKDLARIEKANSYNYPVLVLDSAIDIPFLTYLEKISGRTLINIQSMPLERIFNIPTETTDASNEYLTDALVQLFKKVIPHHIGIYTLALGNEAPLQISYAEKLKRLYTIQRLYKEEGELTQYAVILNISNESLLQLVEDPLGETKARLLYQTLLLQNNIPLNITEYTDLLFSYIL